MHWHKVSTRAQVLCRTRSTKRDSQTLPPAWQYRVVPRNYVVGGSEIGEVSRDRINREELSRDHINREDLSPDHINRDDSSRDHINREDLSRDHINRDDLNRDYVNQEDLSRDFFP